MKNSVRLQFILFLAIVITLLSNSISSASSYKVQSKDTLYSIAKAHNVSVSAIQSVNGMGNSVLLKSGSTITIPDGLNKDIKPSAVVKTTKTKTVNAKKSTSSGSGIYGICRKDSSDVWQGNELVACLEKGDKFEVIDRDEDEYKIKLKDGRTGWILDNWVTLNDTRKPVPMSSRSYSNSSNNDMVSIAMAYRGSRYSRGGMSSRSGFDCSGFVKFLYETKGVSLPRTSSAQFKCGSPVSKSELQPGDIVFFSGTYKAGISHVGLYIGDNKFIHAATTKSGVKVDDLDTPYYARKYTGARRIE